MRHLTEYIQEIPGHKNSNGESAPWVIKDHETNEIIKSFTSKEDAENGLQQMHIHEIFQMDRNDYREGKSPNYREPYSYRQNETETFDDVGLSPGPNGSALEMIDGFSLESTYDERQNWPKMDKAPIYEDGDGGGVGAGAVSGANPANLSTGQTIGNHTPLGGARLHGSPKKRGTISSEWDKAYDAMKETSAELQALIEDLTSK